MELDKDKQIYVIDFEKVNTIEDIKNVLDGLRIFFTDDAPAFTELRPYLKEIENE